MRAQLLWASIGIVTLVLMPTPNSSNAFRHTTLARAATSSSAIHVDDDHDGIDDTAEQMLANRFAPIIFIEPDESNYPVNVDWFLQQRTHVEYHEDCFSDTDDPVSLEPIGSQQDLIGPPWIGHAHCGEDDEGYKHPPHRDITTIATDPDGQKSDGSHTTGYSDQQTFVLPDLPDEVQVGSLDPQQWVTYFHAYPTADGGIMLQYWHIFAYNELSIAGFGRHGGDWDATIHVQLASDLTLKGVWFSRHADDHPGTFLTGSAVQLYQGAHPLMTIDGGGHAAFASPQDACANGSAAGSTVSWTTNLNDPTDPTQLHIVNCAFPDLVSGRAGGTVWETWTGGNVRSAGILTHSLSASLSPHGGMINLGEYNPCTPITCNGSQQASTLLAGEFHPLNGQIFIRYEGRWGSLPHCDLDICATPPRGPVFQGWQEGDESHNGIYTAWYNQGSNSPADPITSPWRQPPSTALTLSGPTYRPSTDDVEYVTGQTMLHLDAQQSDIAAKFGSLQTYYRFYQPAHSPPPFRLYTAPFSLQGADGTYLVEYYSLDALHNEESVQQRSFKKDTVSPQSKLVIGLPQYATAPVPVIPTITPLTLTAEDAGAGVRSISYRYFLQDNTRSSFITVPHSTAQFTLSGIDGLYVVEVFATDNVGNSETTHTYVVRLANLRALDGLQALYPFDEGSGLTIYDMSGVGTALNLTIATSQTMQWIPGGVAITGSSHIASDEPATKLFHAAQQRNELTIEAWIKPTTTTQDGPATIVTISEDASHTNVSLGQGRWGNHPSTLYDTRLRTTETDGSGLPSLTTPEDTAITKLTHVIYTRDASGIAVIYVDGTERARRTVGGDFSNWDGNYPFALANEPDSNLPWVGEYYLVAIYNRALSADEAYQNFIAGSSGGDTEPRATPGGDLFGYSYELWTSPGAPRADSMTQVGVSVHRRGGKAVLKDVVVRFFQGNPRADGTLIGTSIIPLLSPRDVATTSGIAWKPTAEGTFTLYALIDPDNAVQEDDESNNTVSRNVLVLAPARDEVAPHVDAFSINAGAASTTAVTVSLMVAASDPTPGSGVRAILFREYAYSNDAGTWLPVQTSGWLNYPTTPSQYPWHLKDIAGVKYLQAWAVDGAGNISLYPYQAFINYVPNIDTVAQDQGHIYRYNVRAGEQLSVHVTPLSGDPDLYVWAPDAMSGRPPWVSNLRSGVDSVDFVAPVDGVYQIEVYGYTAAEYRLDVGVRPATTRTLRSEGGVDPTKPQHSHPMIPIASVPNTHMMPPAANINQQIVYLPLVEQ